MEEGFGGGGRAEVGGVEGVGVNRGLTFERGCKCHKNDLE